MSKLSFGISFDLIGCVIVVNYEDDEFVTTVYTRRWYLLLLFSLVALMQTLIWATWGPISQSAEAVFSWDDSNIAMTLWAGDVPTIALCIPLSWLMDHKGLYQNVLARGLQRSVSHFAGTRTTKICIKTS